MPPLPPIPDQGMPPLPPIPDQGMPPLPPIPGVVAQKPEPQPVSVTPSSVPSAQLAEYGLLDEPGLPPEYEEFCNVLLSHPEIMNHDVNGLDDAIYDLYSSGTDPGDQTPELGALRPDSRQDRRRYREYWSAILQVAPNAALQLDEGLSPLGPIIESWVLWDKKAASEWRNWVGAFVYIVKDDDAPTTHRVYASPRATDVGSVAQTLLKTDGVVDFKFAGPAMIGSRSDALVVYCSGREAAEEIASEISGKVQTDTGRPAMTEAADQSGAIGIGAEPAWEATGMRTRLKPNRGGAQEANAQSFGTIRSEILASAILYLQENRGLAKKLNITEAELFKRFVGTGLKGWQRALDPGAGED